MDHWIPVISVEVAPTETGGDTHLLFLGDQEIAGIRAIVGFRFLLGRLDSIVVSLDTRDAQDVVRLLGLLEAKYGEPDRIVGLSDLDKVMAQVTHKESKKLSKWNLRGGAITVEYSVLDLSVTYEGPTSDPAATLRANERAQEKKWLEEL